jgi:hypothetical protein
MAVAMLLLVHGSSYGPGSSSVSTAATAAWVKSSGEAAVDILVVVRTRGQLVGVVIKDGTCCWLLL